MAKTHGDASAPAAPLPSLDTLEALLGGLAAARVTVVPVPMPELGGTVHVRRLTADEWLSAGSEGQATDLPDDATPLLKRGWQVARWLCAADGRRLVQPTDLPAIERCAELPFQAAHRILQAAGVLGDADPKA